MRNFKFLIAFLALMLFQSCTHPNLIGHWRRIDMIENTNANQHEIGDIMFSTDSTFILYGTGEPDTSNAPGWHFGGDMNGTWSMPDEKHIIFRFDPKIPYGPSFKIIKLDQTNLIMVSAFDENKKDAMIVKYIRL